MLVSNVPTDAITKGIKVKPTSQTGLTPRVLDSDTRDDRAQSCFLHCLHVLAEKQKEVMLVVSQLQFGKYLHKSTFTAAAQLFPRPLELPPEYRRGDFDVLVIHYKHGLLVGEIKSVGANFSQMNLVQEDQDMVVIKTLKKAATSLKKASLVLQHLISDLPGINITLTLIFPNITSSQIFRCLENNEDATQVRSRA